MREFPSIGYNTDDDPPVVSHRQPILFKALSYFLSLIATHTYTHTLGTNPSTNTIVFGHRAFSTYTFAHTRTHKGISHKNGPFVFFHLFALLFPFLFLLSLPCCLTILERSRKLISFFFLFLNGDEAENERKKKNNLFIVPYFFFRISPSRVLWGYWNYIILTRGFFFFLRPLFFILLYSFTGLFYKNKNVKILFTTWTSSIPSVFFFLNGPAFTIHSIMTSKPAWSFARSSIIYTVVSFASLWAGKLHPDSTICNIEPRSFCEGISLDFVTFA